MGASPSFFVKRFAEARRSVWRHGHSEGYPFVVRSRVPLLIGGGLLAAWGACTPFSGNSVATSREDGGPSANDAGPPGDASPTDGDLPSDVPVFIPCSGANSAELCVDFDGQDRTANNAWKVDDRPIDVDGGKVSIDPSIGRDGSTGLHSFFPTGNDEGRAVREYALSEYQHVFAEADLLVRRPVGVTWSTGSVTVLGIMYGTSAPSALVDAKLVATGDPNQAAILLYGRGLATSSNVATDIAAAGKIPYDEWVRVRIEARVYEPKSLSLAGTATLTTSRGAKLHVDITRGPAGGTVKTRILLGLQRFNETTNAPLDVVIDNVTGGILPP